MSSGMDNLDTEEAFLSYTSISTTINNYSVDIPNDLDGT